MILKADEILARLAPDYANVSERLCIRPQPQLEDPAKLGSASVDLRLGCWFGVLRRNRVTHLDLMHASNPENNYDSSLKMHYTPFGQNFVLHPRDFVLAVTLEWIRMPPKLAGYVIGRSSWGRRGLIIETAAGVHPGFTGCLTLELSNVGQVPIVLSPGVEICQVFIHRLESKALTTVDESMFLGQRRPILGNIHPDSVARALAQGQF